MTLIYELLHTYIDYPHACAAQFCFDSGDACSPYLYLHNPGNCALRKKTHSYKVVLLFFRLHMFYTHFVITYVQDKSILQHLVRKQSNKYRCILVNKRYDTIGFNIGG
jgi:hypothetical protein